MKKTGGRKYKNLNIWRTKRVFSQFLRGYHLVEKNKIQRTQTSSKSILNIYQLRQVQQLNTEHQYQSYQMQSESLALFMDFMLTLSIILSSVLSLEKNISAGQLKVIPGILYIYFFQKFRNIQTSVNLFFVMYKVRKTKIHDGTIYLVQKLRQRILLKKSAMSPIIFLSMFTSTKSSFSLQKKKKEKLNITKTYKTILVGIYKNCTVLLVSLQINLCVLKVIIFPL